MTIDSRFVQWGQGILLALLLSLFAFQPLALRLDWSDLVIQALYGAILIGALAAVSDRKKPVVVGLFLLFPALGFGTVRLTYEWAQVVSGLAALLFLAVVIGAILRHAFTRPRVTLNSVLGALNVFLLLGVAWHLMYELADVFVEDAFSGLSDVPRVRSVQIYYFSIVTLTTLGYGDVTPTSPETMSLASAEAIVGQGYLIVLVAYLVARLVSEHSREP